MLNFTGSLKKRVVNLGDKRAPKHKNFLEQARLERLKREETRQRERCVVVIQAYLLRRVQLLKTSDEFLLEWQSYDKITNWPVWAAQFAFIGKFGRKNDASTLMPRLHEGIAALGGKLDERAVAVLIGTLSRLLRRHHGKFTVFECLELLVNAYRVPRRYHYKWNGIIGTLQSLKGSKYEKRGVLLIFKFNCTDSLTAFLKFVATCPLECLGESEKYSQVLQSILSDDVSTKVVAKFPDTQKLQLLVNVLLVKSLAYSPTDYLVHANVLSTMHFSVKVQSDDIDDELVLESRLETEGGEGNREVTISQQTADVLLVLYSSSYISRAFDQLQTSDKDSKLAVQFISLLMYLFPDARTKLCMMMTIVPGLDHWIFTELSAHPAYVEFRALGQRLDFLSSQNLAQLMDLDDIPLFLSLLHTYQQLLSYWLIVANDVEISHENRFSQEDVLDFSNFLRIFCLTLIFRSNDVVSIVPYHNDLNRLADVSLSLLNQLYIRNLRTKYLPESFWHLKNLKFEIDNMIQMVLDEEELKEENADLSSDDDESRRQSFSRSRHRTPEMTSKLQVLTKVPFFVDFTDRVKVFQSLIEADQERLDSRLSWTLFSDPGASKLTADIHRESILESSFERFHKVGAQFKHKLQITFHNEHGVEAGIDGGGLTKELLTSVVTEGFKPDNDLGLFKETASGNELYPNADIYLKILKRIDLPEQQTRLAYARFLGMIIGKCLYESVLIDVAFAPFFLNKWRVAQSSMKNSINDLKYLDSDLYTNLTKLLEMSAQQIQQLDLDFTINEKVGSHMLLYDLLPPDGESVKVTSANRLNYIHQIANFKLNHSLQIQTKYFLEGLFELIKPTWLNMFDPFELQMLISGGNDIDIDDWKRNVLYGGYFDDDITVTLFWEVVEEMSPQERCDLVKFVTSVSRAPLLGFGALAPKFGIHNSGPSDRLPTASTCVNLLKLPDYKDKDVIRSKLLFSISANSGFDLS